METTIVYWGYIGIMEKKMETTIYNGIILGRIYCRLWVAGLRTVHVKAFSSFRSLQDSDGAPSPSISKFN